jgi:hypothetical protein
MNALLRIWNMWKSIAQLIGDWIGRIVLTVFYFTLFAPFGLGVRLGGDPLAIKPGNKAQWLTRITRDRVIDDARRLS